MLRNILAAIAGYAVMFVFIFVTFSVAYLAMGADTAFAPGGYDVSMMWILISTVLGFVGAVAAGYVAALIGRSGTAVKILAGIVLALGLLTAVFVGITPKPTEARTAATANLEAMTKAQTPLWLAILNPIIGVAGVLVGGGLKKNE